MKKVAVSKLTNFDVHAFTNIVQETVTQSEQRLKSYIDQKLEKQSTTVVHKMDKKNEEQTKELKEYVNEQIKDLATIISDNNTILDKIYVRKEEFKKHTLDIRAHQS